ncbi:cell division protein SepF [Mesoplasma syrphidae]|uniref:Cell division protein SepF n=1 Tax=Mesoplasma syrphidae TaxID=225999 RepID=A0A2K9BJM4_9MOLU|nr:cell division protein SepF [Mesoplasma syrphidae]AUF83476.1 cell division protein SepF [Mesoplasma syrphidae]
MSIFKNLKVKPPKLEDHSTSIIDEYKEEFSQQLVEFDSGLKEFEDVTIEQGKSEALLFDVKKKTHVFAPKKYREIKTMIDELIQNKVILIDFYNLQPDEKRRVKDFLSGVTYALDGEYRKIENEVFKFIISK